jgi:predicted TIM-barrel fold metal-dependent hydrolase
MFPAASPPLTRRGLLLAATPALGAQRPRFVRPAGLLIDTHIHLFDPARFPYHPKATYQPPAEPLEPYLAFVRESRIDHTVIVHPEPYQDDHAYLEHCFAHEPSPGFFKGTCLFDAISPDTPRRIRELTRQYPGRLVALRIHTMRARGAAPLAAGAIKDRDLASAALKQTLAAAGKEGLAIQMHFTPWHARPILTLAREFPDIPFVLDHLGRSGMGTEADFHDVLALAKAPNTIMKFSGVSYSSRQKPPYADAARFVTPIYQEFGASRLIWGGLGHSMSEFEEASRVLDTLLADVPEADRAKVRGLNAKRLYRF